MTTTYSVNIFLDKGKPFVFEGAPQATEEEAIKHAAEHEHYHAGIIYYYTLTDAGKKDLSADVQKYIWDELMSEAERTWDAGCQKADYEHANRE